MIVEFATDPDRDGTKPNYPAIRWHSRMSVDLTWVSAARPWCGDTQICLAGSPDWYQIRCDYSSFMIKWQAAHDRLPIDPRTLEE